MNWFNSTNFKEIGTFLNNNKNSKLVKNIIQILKFNYISIKLLGFSILSVFLIKSSILKIVYYTVLFFLNIKFHL